MSSRGLYGPTVNRLTQAQRDELKHYEDRVRAAEDQRKDEERLHWIRRMQEQEASYHNMTMPIPKPSIFEEGFTKTERPTEPHDPFDMNFEEVERYLTGEVVYRVFHNCHWANGKVPSNRSASTPTQQMLPPQVRPAYQPA
jgi:hypothetical protein